MRTCILSSLALSLAAFTLPSMSFAQSPDAAKSASPAPNISGVWNVRGSPATRYLSYSFSKDDPPMTPWAEERFKATKPSFGPRAVEDSNDPVNPTTLSAVGCFPPGMPRMYLQPFPMEIIQVPGRVIMLFEFNHFIRQIFTDGRPHNTALGPTWLGDSIGHWDGDTLVVDTIGFNDKTWVDRAGHPHSTDMHLGGAHPASRRQNADGRHHDRGPEGVHETLGWTDHVWVAAHLEHHGNGLRRQCQLR